MNTWHVAKHTGGSDLKRNLGTKDGWQRRNESAKGVVIVITCSCKLSGNDIYCYLSQNFPSTFSLGPFKMWWMTMIRFSCIRCLKYFDPVPKVWLFHNNRAYSNRDLNICVYQRLSSLLNFLRQGGFGP